MVTSDGGWPEAHQGRCLSARKTKNDNTAHNTADGTTDDSRTDTVRKEAQPPVSLDSQSEISTRSATVAPTYKPSPPPDTDAEHAVMRLSTRDDPPFKASPPPNPDERKEETVNR